MLYLYDWWYVLILTVLICVSDIVYSSAWLNIYINFFHISTVHTNIHLRIAGYLRKILFQTYLYCTHKVFTGSDFFAQKLALLPSIPDGNNW